MDLIRALAIKAVSTTEAPPAAIATRKTFHLPPASNATIATIPEMVEVEVEEISDFPCSFCVPFNQI